jgi:hypothetical protein
MYGSLWVERPDVFAKSARDFPLFLHANPEIVPQIRSQRLPATFLSIYYSLTIPFNVIRHMTER